MWFGILKTSLHYESDNSELVFNSVFPHNIIPGAIINIGDVAFL